MSALPGAATSPESWPALPYAEWADTCATLHLWTQIVGKIRLKQTPWLNHSWHVALYVSVRGLTTSPIPFGRRMLEIEFDFTDHLLWLRTGEGHVRRVPLKPQTVAMFFGEVMAALDSLGLSVRIDQTPSEIAGGIRFSDDGVHGSYDADYANRFWRVLVQAQRLFAQFRTAFLGKASPVHFFWGSFDLAVTRFSGRRAPLHPGGVPNLPDRVTQEAYSHEVSSAGFWPGGGGFDASFYSYAYPVPAHFAAAKVAPEAATFSEALGEFILPYETVRIAADPDATLMRFLQSTYDAAADAGGWNRAALDCAIGMPSVPRAV